MVCGIDIGTTGAKAALYSRERGIIAEGQAEYSISHPRTGWAEQDPQALWSGACRAVRAAVLRAPDAARAVRAAAVSSQAPTLIALDGRGQPVRPALIWMDRRADRQAAALAERFGEAGIHRLTGNNPDPFYVAAKLLWMRTYEPQAFAAARIFIQMNGYITYRLTGEYSMDPVHAALLQLRKWGEGEWIDELCDFCGVTPERFPPVRGGTEIVGRITRGGAEETGLPEGAEVAAGSVDGAAAALEAGALGAGTAAEMTGTSTVLLIPNDRGATHPALTAMPHAAEGSWLLLGAMSSSGASLKWFRDNLYASASDRPAEAAASEGHPVSYDALTREAGAARPGAGGLLFLPYMMGERAPIWDSDARGVFFGLTLATTRGEMIRAVLEGTAFGLRHNLEVARSAGVDLTELRSVGGGARSAVWNQIKADVLGLPIALPARSGGAVYGDVILAGVAAGLFASISEGAAAMSRVESRIMPDTSHAGLYDERYHFYRRLYEDLRGLFAAAADKTEK